MTPVAVTSSGSGQGLLPGIRGRTAAQSNRKGTTGDRFASSSIQPSLKCQQNIPVAPAGSGILRKWTSKLKSSSSFSTLSATKAAIPKQDESTVPSLTADAITSIPNDSHLVPSSWRHNLLPKDSLRPPPTSTSTPNPTSADLRRASALRERGLLPASRRYSTVLDEPVYIEPKEPPGKDGMSAAEIVKKEWEVKAKVDLKGDSSGEKVAQKKISTKSTTRALPPPPLSLSLSPVQQERVDAQQRLRDWKYPQASPTSPLTITGSSIPLQKQLGSTSSSSASPTSPTTPGIGLGPPPLSPASLISTEESHLLPISPTSQTRFSLPPSSPRSIGSTDMNVSKRMQTLEETSALVHEFKSSHSSSARHQRFQNRTPPRVHVSSPSTTSPILETPKAATPKSISLFPSLHHPGSHPHVSAKAEISPPPTAKPSSPSTPPTCAEDPSSPVPSVDRTSSEFSSSSAVTPSSTKAQYNVSNAPSLSSADESQSDKDGEKSETSGIARSRSSTIPSLSFTVSTATSVTIASEKTGNSDKDISNLSTSQPSSPIKDVKTPNHPSATRNRPPPIQIQSYGSSDTKVREVQRHTPRIVEFPVEFDSAEHVTVPEDPPASENTPGLEGAVVKRLDGVAELSIEEEEDELGDIVDGSELGLLGKRGANLRVTAGPLRSLSLFGMRRNTTTISSNSQAPPPASYSNNSKSANRTCSKTFLHTKSSLPFLPKSDSKSQTTSESSSSFSSSSNSTNLKLSSDMGLVRKGTGIGPRRISNIGLGRRPATIAAGDGIGGSTLPPAPMLCPTMHSRASILIHAESVDDDESRRLSELAFLD